MFYNVLADIQKQFDNLIGRIHSAIFLIAYEKINQTSFLIFVFVDLHA